MKDVHMSDLCPFEEILTEHVGIDTLQIVFEPDRRTGQIRSHVQRRICFGNSCHRVCRKLSYPSCAERDRKSTRLNSSHLVISYAVFCLKKKMKSMYNNVI